jgi:acyl-[acyl-carrier-protein]-phospholipid O-acyltransferase/long-chain-fatty-acid--[acyl-carrier-protein] ligase
MNETTTATAIVEAPQSPASPRPDSWRRGFWSLFATQFQGAFSDNIFKFLVIFLVINTRPPEERDQLISVALGLFALPFLLFSMAGGFLADRFGKREVIIGTKAAEILIMTLGLAGFWLGSVPFLLAVIFLMSAQSAIFGPSKYGSLPELLPTSRLSWGNGVFGLGTFVAIISGGVLAGVLHERLAGRLEWAGVLLIALAGMGLLASLGVSRLPPANPGKQFRINFVGDLWVNIRKAGKDRVLSLAIVGSVYFWFLGALFGEPTILVYSQDVLRLKEIQIAMLRACLAIGIGVGSAAAGYLSGRKIEYGLIPLGAFGLSACAALLAWPGLSPGGAAVILGLLGFSGGFYIVPINALIQHRPDAKDKGSIIAANAWLTSLGVFLASGAFWALKTGLGLQPTTIFLVGAVVTFLGTFYAARLVPDSLLRLLLWMLTHTLYRIRVEGRENIPEKGGALFVANHLSMVDALLLQASTDRPIRFLMFKGMYERSWIKPFARIMRVIPISSQIRPREMIHALRAASEAIQHGEVVCIFAEGQITRIGQMLPFRRGFERIMQGVEAPIVPVCLDGVWGSIFSFEQGRFLWKWPRRIPYPVTICYGKPMPATATHVEVRQVVQELSAEAWRHRKPRMETLDRAFIRTARKHPFRFAMADARTPHLRFGAALTRTVFLARRLKPVWQGQKMVGILLPPSVLGALVNFAALLLGKAPVNLNYTVSDEVLAACARQCGLKTVVTSKAFLDKLKLKAPGEEAVWLEELLGLEAAGERKVRRNPNRGEKLTALLMAWLLPAGLLERALGRDRRSHLDDLATVIFSSGSTGDPKGVMLSHFNVVSNIEQMEQTFAMNGRDRFMGILPFFHSFGFTGTLCLPGVSGVGVAFHPTPLDASAVGNLVRNYAITFLLTTPTFLQLYLRSCEPEDLGSLQFLVTGAEKLPERLAVAFEDKFGLRPMEGYGCTECSPVVAVNTHDFRSIGFRQVGAKRGKIGHPLPGISVRIVDAVTMEPLPVGQPGLLLVKGPNVMQGYLGRPDKTADVLRDGWYVTGDIAALDEDGFLQITDRLSRFSKIGGEMVPHIKVEEKLHELAEATEQTFVVTSVPDEKKGERLVVLHKLPDGRLQACLERIARSDLPNLWKPKADAFFRVEAFPCLGTGKLDLRRVKEMAAALGG